MHLTAGLDAATAGRSWIGETEITALDDRALTLLRRDQVGFIFQSNPATCCPPSTRGPTSACRSSSPGGASTRTQFDHVVDTLGLTDRLGHRPGSSPGASSSASPPPVPSSPARASSSPTSPRARSTPPRPTSCSASCAAASTIWARAS